MRKGEKMSKELKNKISTAIKKQRKTLTKPYFQAFGKDNPACKDAVRKKISKSVKELWDKGVYKNRINGMINKCGNLHHNYSPETERKFQFKKYLSQFQNINQCSRCGKKDTKIDTHHVDEDHKNWLVTNLEPLCVKCHQHFHVRHFIQPYVTIGKKFVFESCHQLYYHPAKCKRFHGHSYHMEVKIKKRIDPKLGMVMDFGDLKKLINEYVIEKVDHFNLNNIMPFQSTAENMIFWVWKQLEEKALIKGLHEISLWETETSVATVSYKDVFEYERNLLFSKTGVE